MSDLKKGLTKEDLNKITEAGVELDSHKKTYFLSNGSFDIPQENKDENVILLPIQEALEKHPFIKEKYWWKLISPDKDEYTKLASQELDGGYFIHVKKGHKENMPLQACFYIKESYYKQKVHNIIILEEGAELHIINGCVSSHGSDKGQHLGITEIYLEKGAFLSYSMVHNWNESTEVFPRSAMKLGEDSQFISNYIALKPTKIVQSYPTVYVGKNAKASLNSIIYSHSNSVYDVGGRAVLEAEGARAEINSRSVSSGGDIIARAHINSKSDKTFGHMECSSLMLNKKGKVHAIPELESNSHDVVLSHEAMVGKIADEEIFYLMSRGLSEKDAVSLIVQGFLNIDIKGLPEVIKEQINQTLKLLENSNGI
ncbi:MAG TPA: hypothetical protein DHW82_12510 [Spirochaetia bacterium]|nr:MAG: hypothetical protein A2Y41_13345 [Spirochaetes bacterium GWB1_36_13]HCL57813.1 hypothetical protein [Spirochaetia bacterium]